jgi:hypothetical protein
MAVYAIEIDGPKNESLVFPPNKEKLRGRWDFSRIARDKSDGMKALALACPVIPGMVVRLDTKAMTGEIVDPLGVDPEGRKVFAKVIEVAKRFPGEFDETAPHPSTSHKLNQDDIKTWLFAMRTAMDCGYARRTNASESLPSIDEIREMPGKRVRDPLNSGSQENSLQRFTDDVPVVAATGGGKASRASGGGE